MKPFILRFLEAIRRPGNHRSVIQEDEYVYAPVATQETQQILLAIMPHDEWLDIENEAYIAQSMYGGFYDKDFA